MLEKTPPQKDHRWLRLPPNMLGPEWTLAEPRSSPCRPQSFPPLPSGPGAPALGFLPTHPAHRTWTPSGGLSLTRPGSCVDTFCKWGAPTPGCAEIPQRTSPGESRGEGTLVPGRSGYQRIPCNHVPSQQLGSCGPSAQQHSPHAHPGILPFPPDRAVHPVLCICGTWSHLF